MQGSILDELPGGDANAQAAKGSLRVTVLATGGTLAGAQAPAGGYGYRSAAFDIADLLSAVPGLDRLAVVTGEQVFNIGSQDMDDARWLVLARRLAQVADSPATDAVLITHGTDTLEETSYFLNLVTRTSKPVVMVGSMRPATATSADGPGNLYNGLAVAVSPGASGRGVLTVLNDRIDYARNVTKLHTTHVQTFGSPNRGPAGVCNTGVVTWFAMPDKKQGQTSEFGIEGIERLPRVDIVYAHAGMNPDLIDAAVGLGAQGLVIAGVGDGNMSQPALDRAAAASRSGVVVVRSTRLPAGIVYRNNEVDDDRLGLVSSGELNPAKSRVLLQLALTRTRELRSIQRMFDEY